MLYMTSDSLTGITVNYASNGNQSSVQFAGFDKADNAEGLSALVAVSQVPGPPGAPRPVALSQYGLYEAQPTSLTSGTIQVDEINPPSTDTSRAPLHGISFGGTYQGQPDPTILYAARGDGTLWFDDNSDIGSPENQATELTGWTYGKVLALAVSPTDSHEVFALTADNLYESTDTGQTWSLYTTQPTSLGTFVGLTIVPCQVSGQAVNLLVVGGLQGRRSSPTTPRWGSRPGTPPAREPAQYLDDGLLLRPPARRPGGGHLRAGHLAPHQRRGATALPPRRPDHDATHSARCSPGGDAGDPGGQRPGVARKPDRADADRQRRLLRLRISRPSSSPRRPRRSA